MQTRFVVNGKVGLFVKEMGDPSEETIIFLHGYPDTHAAWTSVLDRLADRFHVVAYDVRGAGKSSAPTNTKDYSLSNLASDLKAVIEAVSPRKPVHLVGHDWGSIQSWYALAQPSVSAQVRSFTSISGPGLDYVAEWFRRRISSGRRKDIQAILSQLMQSWYIALFQLPLLAPLSWKYGLGEKLFAKLKGRTESDVPTLITDGEKGIALYRANVLSRLRKPDPTLISTPVQLILPTHDRFVGEQLYEGLELWVPNLARRKIQAGHWVQQSHPEAVAAAIAEFIAEHPIQSA